MSEARASGYYWARPRWARPRYGHDWIVVDWRPEEGRYGVARGVGTEQTFCLTDIAEWGPRIDPPDDPRCRYDEARELELLRAVAAKASMFQHHSLGVELSAALEALDRHRAGADR